MGAFGEGDMAKRSDTVKDAVAWLEGEAHRIIRASKREMKDGTAAFPPQVGIHYEAFWLRDYEYTLEGSAESYFHKELRDACRLFVRSRNDDGAGVDCVKFDGTPVYKPGYDTMGKNPVADGGQFTVGVAWHTYRATQDKDLLLEILDALLETMEAVPRNQKTGLVHIDPDDEWDRCPYGFTDTIRKKGDVLFSSLLYVQACRQLSDLLLAGGREEGARQWEKESERVAAAVRKVFWDQEAGLFRAATIQCREHDIWGSVFAVFVNVADKGQSEAVANYCKVHYGEIVQEGQVRHLPGGVYWGKGCARDEYQNGAFWATPTGWFVYTLDLADPSLANQTVLDMVNDFKRHGACEWIIGEKRNLPHYLASAALPLDGIRKMLERRGK